MELEISCQRTKELLDGDALPLLIDCREQQEHDIVAIDRAVLMPMSEFASRAGQLAGREDDHLVVLCHHGGRSAQVAMWLRGQGFEKTQSMAGGIDQWATQVEPGMARY